MKKNVQKIVQNHLQNNRSTYTFTIVLMMMGVIFGSVVVNSLAPPEKQDLFTYIQQFLGDMSKGQVASSNEMFTQSFAHNMKYIGVMWILGFSIIGLPIVLILLFLKGVVVGFTVGFLVSSMGWHGFLVSLVTVLPQNIILLPVFIVMSSAAISFSFKMIRRQFMKNQSAPPIFQQFIRYSIFMIGIVGVLVMVSLFQAYVSPVLTKIVAG